MICREEDFFGPMPKAAGWLNCRDYRYVGSPYNSIVAALQEPQTPGTYSPVLMVTTDSTGLHDDHGNATNTGWVTGLATYLAALFPTIRIENYIWDDTAQDYNAAVVIQAGSAGRRGVLFDATRNRSRKQTSTSVGDITTDIDLRICLAPTSWQPGAAQVLIARSGSSGTRGFVFQISSGGGLSFQWWYNNASDANTLTETCTYAQIGSPAAGSTMWVRVTLDVDNGASGHTTTFYYSLDEGVTWTQAKQSVVAGTTTIANPAGVDYEIGARANSTAPLTATVYAAEVRQGINGPKISYGPIDAWLAVNGASAMVGSPTLYIINGSIAGKTISYFANATRLPLLCPRMLNAHHIFASGYNETTFTTEWTSQLDSFLTAIKAQNPLATFGFTTQGPMNTYAAYWGQQMRQRIALTWALRNGLWVADSARAMQDYIAGGGNPSGDGIHPSPGMMTAWVSAMLQPFRQAH